MIDKLILFLCFAIERKRYSIPVWQMAAFALLYVIHYCAGFSKFEVIAEISELLMYAVEIIILMHIFRRMKKADNSNQELWWKVL